jgi:BolA protein
MNNTSTDKLIAEVKKRLKNAFSPSFLEITDESSMHKGHAGAEDGMKHLSISISSTTLDLMPKLLAHRTIYETLGELMHTHIHALRIRIKNSNSVSG